MTPLAKIELTTFGVCNQELREEKQIGGKGSMFLVSPGKVTVGVTLAVKPGQPQIVSGMETIGLLESS